METKICNFCKENKSLDNFGKNSRAKSGLDTKCLACKNEYARQLYGSKYCIAETCDRKVKARNLCSSHYARWSRVGIIDNTPIRSIAEKGSGHINAQGYRLIYAPNHPHAKPNGMVKEHTKVMSDHIGRMLLPHENVHHINGDKLDNRLENLELWSTSQPAGQRVDDKTAWAIAWLRKYHPEILKEEK